MNYPVNTNLKTDSHYQDLLHEAEMHRLRRSLKDNPEDGRSSVWVPIATFLKLRR